MTSRRQSRELAFRAVYQADVTGETPKHCLEEILEETPSSDDIRLFAATLVEDCGPCTQISVDMAAVGGVDPTVLRAILAGDEAAMGPAAALTWRFARASLARDMETADPLRDEIVRRWGEKGLLAVSMAITTARMYPTLKYALGHGKACSKVLVAGVAAPVAHLLIAA